jgi:hypothetical protein
MAMSWYGKWQGVIWFSCTKHNVWFSPSMLSCYWRPISPCGHNCHNVLPCRGREKPLNFKIVSKAFSGFVKDIEILFKIRLSQASMREFHGGQWKIWRTARKTKRQERPWNRYGEGSLDILPLAGHPSLLSGSSLGSLGDSFKLA